MGFMKFSLILCLLLVIYSYLQSVLEPNLEVVFDGYHHPAFKPLADKYRSNFQSGKDRGSSFAVYHKGRPVFHMWGGYADAESKRPWDKDTMTMTFSASKGIAAIVVAHLVDKGLLDYKRHVAEYWPEFGQNEKGNITVEMLLSHQAGLSALDEPIHLRDILDNPDKVERLLAAQKTLWPAGTQVGYHVVTYGLYVDALVRKVDTKGRNIDKIFLEEIAEPFNLSMAMTTKKEIFYKVARLVIDSKLKILGQSILNPRYFPILGYVILFPESMFPRAAHTIVEFTKDLHVFNDPHLREVPMSASQVTTTADSLAKLYGILANGGSEDEKVLLTKEQINKLQTSLGIGLDIVTMQANANFGPGVIIIKNSKGQPMYGHTGHGGQVGLADPTNQLGIGYITNFISIFGMGDDPRYLDLEHQLYECLDDYLASQQ